MMLPFKMQKDSIKIMLKIIRPNIIKCMILLSEQQISTIHVLANVSTFTNNRIKKNYNIRSVDGT